MVEYTGGGLAAKRPGGLSKVQMLTLVLGVGVFSPLPTQHNLLAWLPLQKLVGEFFSVFGREILREIRREFSGIFSDPQNKGSKFSGKISEHFS